MASSLLAGCGSDGERGAPGERGEQGPPGGGGTATPSVSAVLPSRVFLAREVEVTVSGYATNWTENSTLDFGPGVRVKSVTAASPTSLVATLEIAADAPVGARDVKVKEGGSETTYAKAFRVESPIEAFLGGTVAQGSVVYARVENLEAARPFDTKFDFDSNSYPNISIARSPGVTVQVRDIQLYSIDFAFLVDVNAAPGKRDIVVTSGPPGAEVTFRLPGALDIQKRDAVALTAPQTVTLAQSGQSALFTFTPGAAFGLVDLVATVPDGKTPQLIVLPKSGRFADMIQPGPTNQPTASTLVTSSADPYYAIFVDPSGATGYSATIRGSYAAASSLAEADDNDTPEDAQVAPSLPFVLRDATLSSVDDEDWVKITVAEADLNKAIRVMTYGDRQNDTLVEVFDADGETVSGPSSDQFYHERFLTSPITKAGEYFVKISHGSESFRANQNKYEAIIRLE
jgi:hypothetical protein